MNKQDFVLDELETMAKDMGAMVCRERKLAVERGKGNANNFIQEIIWFQRRLDATKEYLNTF